MKSTGVTKVFDWFLLEHFIHFTYHPTVFRDNNKRHTRGDAEQIFTLTHFPKSDHATEHHFYLESLLDQIKKLFSISWCVVIMGEGWSVYYLITIYKPTAIDVADILLVNWLLKQYKTDPSFYIQYNFILYIIILDIKWEIDFILLLSNKLINITWYIVILGEDKFIT